MAAVVGQLRRRFVERAGACYLLRRQDDGRAEGVSRSAGLAVWQENPECRAVSVHHLLDDVDDDRSVLAPVGLGSGWDAASVTRRRHSLGWERSATKRSLPSVQ